MRPLLLGVARTPSLQRLCRASVRCLNDDGFEELSPPKRGGGFRRVWQLAFVIVRVLGIVWYLHYKVSSANISCKYEVVTERQVPCSHFLIPRCTCGSDGARATRGHPAFPFPKLRW